MSTADGYPQTLDAESFAAPAWVYDTDPDVGLGDVDVDEVRGPALHVLWSAVEGAARYEWALFTVRGDPVMQNPSDPSSPFLPTVDARVLWATVRNGLVAGARYVFVVRAVGADGSRSAETLSDGVTWLPEVAEPPADAAGIGDANADTGVVDASVVRDEGPPGVDATARASCEGSVAQCHPDLALEGRGAAGALYVPGYGGRRERWCRGSPGAERPRRGRPVGPAEPSAARVFAAVNAAPRAYIQGG